MAEVSIAFNADIDDLIKGIDRVKAQLQSVDASTKSSGDTFNELGATIKTSMDTARIDAVHASLGNLGAAGAGAVSKLSGEFSALNAVISKGGAGGGSDWVKAMLGGGAIGLAAAGALDLVDKVNNEMLTLSRNAKEAGLSLQKIQELKYTANVGGVSNDAFVSGLQEASKKLNELARDTNDLSKFLDANNVKYKEAGGHLISMDAYIEKAALLIRNAGTEADKLHFADLMGFSRSWVAVLEQGPTALRRSEAEPTPSAL